MDAEETLDPLEIYRWQSHVRRIQEYLLFLGARPQKNRGEHV